MLDFIGIGAQKSATTWVYERLSHHPGIKFPAGKEIHFWDKNYTMGIDWYRSIFDNENFINGEITPSYGHLDISKISEIYSNFPKLKILLILRNPIDRAWASAKMALDRSELLFHEASDQWFIDHFKSSGSISRSAYERNLINWRSVFPENQILILRYEEIEIDPNKFLNHILNHLELDDFYTGNNSQKVFVGTFEPLRESLKPFLFDMYKNQIISLGRYLEQDFSSWIS